ncbi:hypothetical protein AAIB33_15925 [Microbacterium sp. AZCO]|uniref:hypothetical protein n=1 Tax=Microbacterium sp. AZCO TaxID=3142976 RepID=UPI0031F4322A
MGDLDIRSGGVVAVDTDSLYAAADRLDALEGDLHDLTRLLREAAHQVEYVPGVAHTGAIGRAYGLVGRAGDLTDRPGGLAARLRDTAALYETVELHARRAAAESAGDAAAMARIDARLEAIEAEHPSSGARAWWAELWRDASWAAPFVGPAVEFGSWLGMGSGAAGAGIVALGLTTGLRSSGGGTILRGERLTGPAPAVELIPVTAAVGAEAGAPTSLAGIAARIPSDPAARVRVERYTMPDGSRQYAVYVAGTTSRGPWDFTSNKQLYLGQKSASYEATLEALRAAGAKPGDTVHAFGYSQGAMITSRLAVEGGFDTRTLVTFGSPVDAEVGDGTLDVTIRHTDDPVGAIAGGGLDGGTGAAGSFVAERSVDPPLPVADPLAAHHIGEYEQTAAMLDASSDPRMDAVRGRLDELQSATSVEVLEFGAERTPCAVPVPGAGAPGGVPVPGAVPAPGPVPAPGVVAAPGVSPCGDEDAGTSRRSS